MKWPILLLIPLIPGLVWWLYDNGYACYNNKSAVSFIGRSGSGSFGASFTACTGTFGRCLKPKAEGDYRFSLSAELSKGSVQGRICRGKELLAQLDSAQPEAVLPLKAGTRYKVELRFVRASGSSSIHWIQEDRR